MGVDYGLLDKDNNLIGMTQINYETVKKVDKNIDLESIYLKIVISNNTFEEGRDLIFNVFSCELYAQDIILK